MIQQSADPDSIVFIPRDSEFQWKLAKRIFEGSNSMYQMINEHMLQSHFVVETFATATYRTFPHNHPGLGFIRRYLTKIVIKNRHFSKKRHFGQKSTF